MRMPARPATWAMARARSAPAGIPLARKPKLETRRYATYVVLHGQKAMPPVGRLMTDEQVAAVVTYVRTHFGNDYGAGDGRRGQAGALSIQRSGLVHQLDAIVRSERRSTSALARSRSAQTATICAAPCSCSRVEAWTAAPRRCRANAAAPTTAEIVDQPGVAARRIDRRRRELAGDQEAQDLRGPRSTPGKIVSGSPRSLAKKPAWSPPSSAALCQKVGWNFWYCLRWLPR